MTRRKAPLHVNQFVGGLNTELSPLSNNIQTSRDELNMELNQDGSRSKRVGMDLETGSVEIDTTVPYAAQSILASTSYRWENAGGDPDKSLLIVQVASSIHIFDLDTTPISDGLIYSQTFGTGVYSTTFSFTTIDGVLVVANGEKTIKIYEYDSGTVTASTDSLLIRDLFGVEAFEGATILTSSQNTQVRPAVLEETHTYNLRNQTFNFPRFRNNLEVLSDPIDALFLDSGSTQYPSNSDSVIPYLYPDANDTDNRLVNRFFSDNLFNNPLGSTPAPRGHFIIDALERGVSRLAQEAALRGRHSALTQTVTTLPADTTPGGATVVEEFAGRVWYSGFSSELTSGDNRSPRMSSYVLFSQVVKDRTNIAQCYQVADPTSEEDNVIVDDDGGFIRLDGAYGIKSMVNVAGSLFVFAENGVWRIFGKDQNFSATGYSSDQLSDFGCVAPDSVVQAHDNIFYWGDSAIFVITRNEFGIWVVEDITKQAIKTRYIDIDIERKKSCSGHFDKYDRSIRWVYNTANNPVSQSDELRFHIDFKAFTPMSVTENSGGLPRLVSVSEINPYTSSEQSFPVTVNGVVVTASGEDVTSSITFRSTTVRDSVYVVLTDLIPTVKFSLGTYTNLNLVDWESQNPTGTDYDAYITSQNLTFGEPRSRKQTSYVYTYLRRTETGFDSLFVPLNCSSCLLSVRWAWSNSNNSNKWSLPRQAYRQPKTYFPTDQSDTFDTGFELITTRNKIRGSGEAVSLKLESEKGKNLHVYGWSFDVESSGER